MNSKSRPQLSSDEVKKLLLNTASGYIPKKPNKWVKKDQYYAENGGYTLSWGDSKPRKFVLYHGVTFIEAGTREECLEAFKRRSQ